ncbi:radical SAM protein [Streptomyces sp. PT12]|uniref:radical SAM protein n=1 Tax=Streptomyces sp. PT12 TaxID=1510197 RepID=UPI000DE27C6F|nr:radical SAM protein [Streptomyces sp. PT12]RBM07320.1 radical SAM protein [Streptomyces sp. PT12]
MHKVIVSPFLDGFLAVQPGNAAGIRLPESHYSELRSLTGTESPCPSWLVNAAREAWGLELEHESANGALLVREPSEYGFGRASWEINLGCNFACKHCYLGLKEFSGLSWGEKVTLLDIMRDAGVLWLQITGGEPTIDKHFQDAYRYAASLGMMLTISTNASRLWESSLLAMFEQYPAYRIVVSIYGASEASFDGLTQRRGAWKSFQRGMAAAREAGLPVRLNIVVTEDSAQEIDAMVAMAEDWGLKHHVYTNMTPTIYGGPESLLAQSSKHLRERTPFQGCNAGHTFFHADPHAKVSICKVGRDDQIDLMAEGIKGLRRLPGVADKLMLRTGGCSGCQLSGSCLVCRPLAKQFQEAKAPLHNYCQHGQPKKETVTA